MVGIASCEFAINLSGDFVRMKREDPSTKAIAKSVSYPVNFAD